MEQLVIPVCWYCRLALRVSLARWTSMKYPHEIGHIEYWRLAWVRHKGKRR